MWHLFFYGLGRMVIGLMHGRLSRDQLKYGVEGAIIG